MLWVVGNGKLTCKEMGSLPDESQLGCTTKGTMTESPARYGGIAAVLVFGIGLLAVGKTWAGLGVLVIGATAMAMALSSSASGKALFAAIGAVVLGGVLGCQAASNEVSGTAIYHHGFGRRSRSELVTREVSPAKFREATNVLWAGSIICVLGGAIAFGFSRKLDDCAADF
jgi:hypothetical protein